jgi:hypothetical protein
LAARIVATAPRDVEPASGRLGDRHVARDHDLLRRGGDPAEPQTERDQALVHAAARAEPLVLRVVDHRNAEDPRVLERAAHQVRVRDRHAVVGDGDDSRLAHLADLGEVLAPEPDGDGADRVDAGEPGLGGAFEDQPRDRGVVVHRIRVRHAGDRGEAAGDGGRGAGRDRLLVLVARLAEVHVRVDQPRHHPEAVRIDRLGGLRAGELSRLRDRADQAALDPDVVPFVDARGRIDQPTAADHERALPSAAHAAPSASSGTRPRAASR